MKKMTAQYSSIKGALYGVAVGDALGGPVEFMGPEQIAEKYGRVTTMVGGGWLNLQPGEITDDTQMTLCVAMGIVESPSNPTTAIGRRFIRWADGGPKDIGGACASSIFKAKQAGGEEPTGLQWAQASLATQRAQGHPVEGNGALMRTVYPGLYYRETGKAELCAAVAAQMTHAGDRSTEACKLYSRMVNLLTTSVNRPQEAKSPREFLAEHCRAVPEYYAAATAPDVVHGRLGGWVVDAMRIAVGSVATTTSFFDAVVTAVNLGGDADTNGAITGGLAGAWYGYEAIPEEWVAALAPDVRETLDRLAATAASAREGS